MDNEAFLNEIEGKFKSVVDDALKAQLANAVGPMVAENVSKIVQDMRVERILTGHDRSGLSAEQKKSFAESVKAVAFRTKANEALIEEQDSRGGLLVSVEVANAILRIAASVGITLNQAQKWPMTTDELDIPSYRGAFLTGEYLGVDAAGTPTALTFNQAKLINKKWQLAFVLGNDLLQDASANLADWLLALGAESLANMIDKQAFAGAGPFVGLLNDSNVRSWDLGGSTSSGSTTFSSFSLDDASDMIGQVEESVLDGAAFYFERTVWAKIRMAKDDNHLPIFSQANAPALIDITAKNGGIRPAGAILDFPVYTVRHLPANSATAVSTKFCAFGNLKAFAYGDRGEMRVAQFASGSFGGKEIGLADQTALVYKHRHALVNALPGAFVIGKTAAS